MSATIGMIIQDGDSIKTGAKAYVSLLLPDRSVVSLPSQSAVRVSRLRRTMLTGNIMRLFAIEKGSASAVVTPMPNPRSSFEFTTPVAVSTVRGTRFRMNYDPERGRATSAVLERSEEHTSELQSLMRISFAVFCLKTKNNPTVD